MARNYNRSFKPKPAKRQFSRVIRRARVEPLKRRTYYLSIAHTGKSKKSVALLIAAHNEELVLGNTLESAINADMKPEHIYLVDDGSTDATRQVARKFLPAKNVIKIKQSGKGGALAAGAQHFDLTKRYRWIHIADADGAFSPNYFTIFRRELRSKNAAATGYVRSLPGKRVSEYRVFEYTIGMEVHRRLQVLFNIVPVIPGPTSCFRADVFEKLNFDNKSLTEDFDVTMQLHRLKLGRVQFIPKAVAYTQDPQNLHDYTKQIARWNRGGLQSMRRYKIGRKLSLIDAYLTYQIMQNLMFFLIYLVWVPYVTLVYNRPGALAAAFILDVIVTFAFTTAAALRTRRPDVISAFPFVYALRWVSLAVFLKSFFEVIVLGKYRHTSGIWSDRSRRYKWRLG